jgi:hypothetical protein
MLIQTTLNNEDFEILTDFCNSERISVSALLKTLVVDFLDSTDKEHIAHIISEAKKIKPGRPKEGDC